MWFSSKRRLSHFFFCLRLISLARLWNLLLLVISFFRSRLLGKPLIWGQPWALSIEPAGICNLQCPECPVGAGVLTRKGSLMPIPLFQKIVNETAPQLMWLNLYFQGEPLLNRHLPDMAALASKHRIYTSMSTNGHFLTDQHCRQLIDARLTRILISIDGITPEIYATYRKGGNLNKVLEGVKRLVQLRRQSGRLRPFITVQFVVFKHNEHEIEPITAWCREAGVDQLELKSAQINDFGNHTVAPSSIARYSRYRVLKDGTLQIKGKIYNHCFKQWGSAVVSWDGRLAPCCYDKNLEYSPGNILEVPFKSIWSGQNLNHFRSLILKNKNQIEMCRNCPEGRRLLL